MAFTIQANLSGVFPMPVTGQSSQGLPLNTAGLKVLGVGLDVTGLPGSQVANQPPQPTSQPITQQPFTLAGIGDWIGAHKLVALGILVGAIFLIKRA